MAKLHFRPYIPNQTVLFPQRIDENIAANDPVRIVNTVVDNLNLDLFKKLYKDNGRCPYHPKMMLKVILYAYMKKTCVGNRRRHFAFLRARCLLRREPKQRRLLPSWTVPPEPKSPAIRITDRPRWAQVTPRRCLLNL